MFRVYEEGRDVSASSQTQLARFLGLAVLPEKGTQSLSNPQQSYRILQALDGRVNGIQNTRHNKSLTRSAAFRGPSTLNKVSL
jgi:hypothetical protein